MVIRGDAEKFFQIRVKLPSQEKEEPVEFLKRNINVFAWDACDAPGIDPAFICHHLNVNPSITPKKQSPLRLSRVHAEAIREEVMKLKRAGAIKEVFTLSGWPTPWWSRRKTESGEFAWILWT